MIRQRIYLAIVALLVICCYVASVAGKPAKNRQTEIEKEESCKNLCEHCGCTGFYCGEECICECNNKNDEDMSCVTTMQENCEKLKLPFEVLIQGPTENRIVRSLLKTEAEEEEFCLNESNTNHKRRSTISIYMPNQEKQRIRELHQPQIHINKALTRQREVSSYEKEPIQETTELNMKFTEKSRFGPNLKRHAHPEKYDERMDRFSELQENERYANAPLIKRDVGDFFENMETDTGLMPEMKIDDILDQQLHSAITEKRQTRMFELFEGARLGLEKLGAFKWVDIEAELAKLGAMNLGLANLADLNLGLIKIADWNLGLANLAEVDLGLSRLLGANLGLDLSQLADWNLGLIKMADIDFDLLREKLGLNAELLKSTFDLALIKEKIGALTDIDLGLTPLTLDFWRGADGNILEFAALKSILGANVLDFNWNNGIFGAPNILGLNAIN